MSVTVELTFGLVCGVIVWVKAILKGSDWQKSSSELTSKVIETFTNYSGPGFRFVGEQRENSEGKYEGGAWGEDRKSTPIFSLTGAKMPATG